MVSGNRTRKEKKQKAQQPLGRGPTVPYISENQRLISSREKAITLKDSTRDYILH